MLRFPIIALMCAPTLALGQGESPVFAPAERVVDRLISAGTVEWADFDSDGDLDVIAAANGNNQLAWFEQTAPGAFGWVKLFDPAAMGDDWNDFRVVDWNADGRMDVMACEEGGLVFLEQLEDGSLAEPVQLRASPNPFRLDIADVNGDGHLDVTYADSQSGEVVLLLGAGSGAVSEFETPMQLAGAAVVLFADWNADGALDWLVGSYTWGTLSVRYGDGEGGFAEDQIVADFGKLSAVMALPNGTTTDLILGVDDTYVIRWHNDGSPPDTLGLFAKAQQFDLADANGDGHLDIAVAAQTSNECGLILGDGAGGFLPNPIEFNVPQALDVALADVDGDGVAEMLTASRSRGQIGWRDFDAAGTPTDYHPILEGLQYVRNVAVGDLNGDGLADAAAMVQGTNVFGGGPEYLNVAFSQPGGGWEVQYVPTGTYFGYDVVLADYDGDGDLDAVVSDYNGDRVVGLRNDGSGALALSDTLIPNINGCDDVVLSDLDMDGDLDLVAGAWQGSAVMVALNTGNGQFSAPTAMTNAGSRCEAVAADDFNGDGLIDLAACFENSGDVRIWLRTAGSAPETLAFESPQILTLSSAQDLAVGDADGDGDVDLFGVGYNELGVRQFTNDGQGSFAEAVDVGFTDLNGSLGLTVGDPDGDGFADLVVSEYGGGRTRLYHAASASVVELAAGSGPQNAAFGDVDGDGDEDVVLSFYQSAEIQWTELLEGMQPAPCSGDINADGTVSTADLTEFLVVYGCGSGEAWASEPPCGRSDLNGDGGVNVNDLIQLLVAYSEGCGS